MAGKIGNTDIDMLYFGSSEVSKIYQGPNEIWTASQTYTITPTLTNVVADGDNPSTISTGESKTLVFYSNDGYTLPQSISVTGATNASWVIENYDYSQIGNELTIDDAPHTQSGSEVTIN